MVGMTHPTTMKRYDPRRSTMRPANGDSSRTGSPNIANVKPMRSSPAPRSSRNRLQITSYVPPA